MTLRERDIYDEIVRLNRLLIDYKCSGKDTDFICNTIRQTIKKLDELQATKAEIREMNKRNKKRR